MAVMTVLTIVLYVGTALTQVAIVLFSLVLVLGAIVGLSVIRTTNPVIVRAQDQLGQIFGLGHFVATDLEIIDRHVRRDIAGANHSSPDTSVTSFAANAVGHGNNGKFRHGIADI